MYSKILVPIDGSDNSTRALRHGLYLSSKLGSKLTVLNVLETPPVVYVQSQKVVDSVINTLEKESEEVFQKVDIESREFDVEYEPIVVKDIMLHLL